MRRSLSLVGVLGVVLLATVYGALGVPLTLGSTGPTDTGSLADTPEGADSTAGSSTTTTPSNLTTTTASTDTERTTSASTTTSSSGDTTTTSTTDDPATTSTADATTTTTKTAASSSGSSSQADDTAETTTTTSSASTSRSDQSGDGSDDSDDTDSDTSAETDGDATASDEVNVSFPSCTEVRIDNLEDSGWELEYVSLRVWLLDDWTRDGPPPIDTHMTGLPQNDTGPVYTYANDSLVQGDLYIVDGVTLVSPEGEHVEWSNPHDCEFVVGVSDNGTVSQPRDDP